jgi:murein L,D-transpeptidase YcbB/YkuD
VTDQAEAIIEILKEADAKGLNSEDYDGSRWADRLTGLSSASDSDLVEFDLALTVSVMRYISDLHFGRANPGVFRTEFDIENESVDIPLFLRQRLIPAADVRAVLQGIEPPYEGYRRTLRALQKYIAMAREDHGGLLPVTKKPVEPGAPYTAVAVLADRLRRLGDLPEDVTIPPDLTRFARPLVEALKHFQLRHGLEPDGRLGKATLAQLNTPLSDRIRQLQFTLERWRWVPHSFPRPPIVVNIPEFELRALDDSYATELEMKVVVGKSYDHQTPVFAADMKSVTFRPYWNVPLSIQRAELMPKLDKDAAYLAKNRYEVVTPKSRRDFSHGCIRAEKAQELAAWVLRNQSEWTPERIADAMDGTETVHVHLDKPIPVLIVYVTAVALQTGEVRFFEDIYGQDAQLAELLAKGYPYPSVKTAQPKSRIGILE